jgi:DNA-directed RNA polymerase subunit beta'
MNPIEHNNIDIDFDAISLKMASPEKILSWSHGEVTKPETINYRTQRSEKHGLFDERIFGPEKDFECYCGKYKGIRYKGIECEKCGVEVTRSIVRRERMGHIELSTPVSHIWFLRNVPSRMALVLGVTAGDLEKVIYFAGHIVTSVNEDERSKLLRELEGEYKSKMKGLKDEKSRTKLKEMYLETKREINAIKLHAIFDDALYGKYSMKYGAIFEAEIGSEAIYKIFSGIDMAKLEEELVERLETAKSTERVKLRKRLGLVRSLKKSKQRPEWMFLQRIPVIPAALRPMVALDGGRHATSDLNDLYRRVINRNNRLKKLLDINAPHVILRNEKRILQEAVDALIDNSMRRGTGGALSMAQRRPLKSLSDNLKGKQGIFRGNLLGKRVDYSGRSVIVVGPELAIDECGLPKNMALELFRPFVISQLIDRELAYNIRGAGRLIDEKTPEVWEILEEVIDKKYVLLNRAPTLHRLGIQAFRPTLIEGNAIQIHPLVVQAYNADFDGDQMAVHVPLSPEAQLEAREFMASNHNLLSPGNGGPIISVAHQDIILGVYWTTRYVDGANGEGKIFESPNAAILAHDFGAVSLRAKIKVLPTDSEKYKDFEGEIFETSVGRLLFNNVFANDYPYIDGEISKGDMSRIVDDLIVRYDNEFVAEILDKIKNFGFKYSTESGTTFGLSDVSVPEGKEERVIEAQKRSDDISAQYEDGLLSEDERYRMNTEVWQGLRSEMESLSRASLSETSSVFYMLQSGARGNVGQLTNMLGLKGLVAGSSGRVIDFPVLSSSIEGLTPLEYFIGTHGSRKGLGDTALNTAQSGYLTRRLFDVAQDIVVIENDCKTKQGIKVRNENLGGIEISLAKNIKGRYLSEDMKDDKGKVIKKAGEYISSEESVSLEATGASEAYVRSPMTCETLRGVCQKCYGVDLATGETVDLGEAVGTVAAQSIGEPATQLTMRTFHAGGTASVGGDIVSGLPRVEEIFERRPPKNPAVIADRDGVVVDVIDNEKEKIIQLLPTTEVKYTKTGKVSKSKQNTEVVEYSVHFHRMPLVKKGDEIKKGDLLTDGSADLTKLFKYADSERTREYIISEISKIYELQGASVSRKHIEVIIKQMFSRVKIEDPGDTNFLEGETSGIAEIIEENQAMKDAGKAEAKYKFLVLGITNVSLSRSSFLSAASFINTNRVLINASLQGKRDGLVGLKENVIVGRLIPAGTGFSGSKKYQKIQDIKETKEE